MLLIGGCRPGEPAPGDHRLGHTQQPGLPWLVEVQAARVVARLDTKRDDRAILQQLIVLLGESQLASAFNRGDVLIDWHVAPADQRESPGGAVEPGSEPARVNAKGADRDNQKTGGRH